MSAYQSFALSRALILLVCLGAISTHAATRTWTGGHASSANWNLRDNWGGVAVPANGDTLVFPAGAARLNNTNNIAGLRLHSIVFDGAGGGYILRGNSVSLSNGITVVTASANTLRLDSLSMGGPQTINVAPGAGLTVFSDIALSDATLSLAAIGDLTLRGAISGSGNINKTGAGQLSLSGEGANTFIGSLTVASGTLAMNKFETISLVPLTQVSRIAVPGNLVLGNGSGTVVATAQFEHQIANSATVIVNEDATLDFNDHDDIVNNLMLTGGTITTGDASLQVGGDVTANASSGTSVISGFLFLINDSLFSVADGGAAIDLNVQANVSGGIAHITKTGAGTMRLGGTNTYLGMTFVNGGQLNAGNDSALGGAGATTVINAGAQLLLEHGVDTLGETLRLSGEGIGGTNAALRVAGSADIATSLILDAPATINVPSGSGLSIQGVVSGTGPLTKIGSGMLQMAGNSANTFTGDLLAEAGLLLLSKTSGVAVPGNLIIGTSGAPGGGGTAATARHEHGGNVGGAVTVNAGSLYDLNDFNEAITGLNLNGGGDVETGDGLLTVTGDIVANASLALSGSTSTIGGALSVSTGARNIVVAETGGIGGDSTDLHITARISGTASIFKSGSGDLSLAASNTFSGALTVEAGELQVSHGHALGSAAALTSINGDARFVLSGGIEVEGETLVLNTTGQANGTALRNHGTNIWAGEISLLQTPVVDVRTNSVLNVSGAITGAVGITKIGPGLLIYSGASVNTYSGATHVNAGTLRLERAGGANRAIPGALIVGDGVGGLEADAVEAVAPSQINNMAPVTVNASGALRVLGDDIIGSLSGSGRLELQGALVELQTGENDASTTFSGVIYGTGGLRKRGDGTFTIAGTNTYSGATVVAEGTLLVNGEQLSSDVVVLAGGTLGGNGKVGNLSVSGTLAPGNPHGYLEAESVDMAANSHLAVEINGPSSSNGYDSIYTTGPMNVAGAVLDVSLGWAPSSGQQFSIAYYDSLAGEFQGLPDGSLIVLNHIPLHLDYADDTSHRISLTVGELALRLDSIHLEGGNGNGLIDPDECNDFHVAIENTSVGAVNILDAYLESLDPNRVAVTRSEGAYGAVPAGGVRTNRAAFQIRTSPSYPCGYPTRFHLIVNTEAHGRFAIPVSLPSGVPGSLRTYPSALAPAAIPDGGALSSQLPVTDNFAVARVRVSLHATHPSVGQLRLRLIPPIGPEIVLAANEGGVGDNYGTSCSRRTVFDDTAPINITTAAAPFSGTFAPEGNLADLIGRSSVGIWTLLVEDTVAGAVGALQCWTLELAPAECAPGGGGCASCLPTVSGTLGFASPTMPQRLNVSGYETGCGNADPCPGPSPFGKAPFRYSTHNFTNNGPETCVTAVLNVPCTNESGALRVSAYLGDFDPGNLCQNLIGFAGLSASGGLAGCSFRVPAGQRFTVVVNENNNDGPFQGCEYYSLELYGLPCPQEQPRLHIANDAGPDAVRLHWSTAYPGFQLQKQPALAGGGAPVPVFTNVPTAPVVIDGHYSVTNQHSRTNNGFFRLRKP